MDCPICGFSVADQRGLASHFRHQSNTHPDYSQWQEEQERSGKQENLDYVICQICGYRAKTLASHLKPVHSMSVSEYQKKFPGALIRPIRLTEKRREAMKNRKGGFGKGDKKQVFCPSCNTSWVASKFLAQNLHDFRCPACKQKAEDARWAGKTEPQDYVTCLECDYRAENLTSHIQNAHPGYREKHPDALVVALGSAIRDKTTLQGKSLSDETKQKMSENAGRWNAGLTKETDARIADYSQKLTGRGSWNRGLTASDDPRLAETARKLKFYTGENRPWDNGLAAGLTLKDFEPFMDSEGRVDHHKVVEATGVSWHTVRKYILDLGLKETRKYIEDAADDRTIRIDKEVLEQFKLGNGKVSIGKAISVLGHNFNVIKRECLRHGLPTFHRCIRQAICMNAVSEALGGLPYVEEWKSWDFVNPLSGHRFRFDGYFPDVGLIVEFQGYQHYVFPNAYMPDESYLPVYEALLERDRIKKSLIDASPNLIYFEVREEEPYIDVMYLKGRLKQLGFSNSSIRFL